MVFVNAWVVVGLCIASAQTAPDASENQQLIAQGDSPAIRGMATVSDLPKYPESLAAQGFSGRVIVRVRISQAGVIKEARVLESSHPLFEKAVTLALQDWRFDMRRPKNLQPRLEAVLFEAIFPFYFKATGGKQLVIDGALEQFKIEQRRKSK
jgi:TonB family protein